MAAPNLKSETSALLSWLTDKALPFWADTAIDPKGGWYEHLALNGSPNTDVIRRLRVQARQIYVYALADKMGWYDGKDIVDTTFTFMTQHGFEPDGRPGFIHLLAPDYSVDNDKRDLYDHAFYLFSCAWAFDRTGHADARETANKIMGLIDRLRSPSSGWAEGIPASLPRRQNPHMHMLEAVMAWHDLTDEPQWMAAAGEVFTLFETHFFDTEHSIIREFFLEDWRIAPGTIGQTSEPGHLAEWIWLLWMYETRSGTDTSAYANALYANMCRKTGPFLNDEEDVLGATRRDTKRLWVQTEVIKAHLAQANRGVEGAADSAAHVMNAFRQSYLNNDGTWNDQLDANGRPTAETIPTSTFYHIICMIYEAQRCKALVPDVLI